MPPLPRRFLMEIRKAQVRMEGRQNQLLLLNHESLAWLDRWRAERHWRKQAMGTADLETKDI